MKLVIKFALALLCGMLLILVAYVAVGLRVQLRDFEEDAARDQAVMARAVSAAVVAVWMLHGREQALDVVNQANEREQAMQIRWVDPSPGADAQHFPIVEPKALVDQLAGGKAVRVYELSDGVRRMVTHHAIGGDLEAYGVLEIDESLAQERAIVRGRIIRTAITGLAMAAIAGILALALGFRLVGRPIERLIGMARAIGAGDFSKRLETRGGDEMGQLARAMNLMSEELDRALVQLRHADRLTTVGKLAAGIAHELGTPLHVIGGRAKLIANEVGAPELVVRSAEIVNAQVEKMSRIIRQLLDFARGPSLAKQPTDLREILKDCVAMLGPMAQKRQVELELVAHAEPAVASVDRIQVQQVVTNLVVNAIQASAAQQTITLGIQRLRASPPGQAGSDRAVFFRCWVKDQGCGMASDVLEHIFEPFFTTKDVGEGTGLGLAVAFGIVREHHGWIAVDTEVGRGSCFGLFLPAENP